MRIVWVLVTVLAALIAPHLALAQSDAEHTEWVGHSLARMDTIKPGMTRAQLLRVFTIEGGISTNVRRAFVYKQCRYFHVDVVFQPHVPGAQNEDARDTIISISQPYLAQPRAD